jgi:hypothetical protein
MWFHLRHCHNPISGNCGWRRMYLARDLYFTCRAATCSPSISVWICALFRLLSIRKPFAGRPRTTKENSFHATQDSVKLVVDHRDAHNNSGRCGLATRVAADFPTTLIPHPFSFNALPADLLRMKKVIHSLLLAIVASAMLPVFASPHEPIGEREAMQIRAVLDTSAAPPETSAAAQTTAQAATSAAETPSTTAAIATSSAAATAATSAAPPSSEAGVTTTHASSAPDSTTPGPAVTSVLATATNAAGQIVTSYIVSTPTVSSAAPPPTDTSSDSDGGGLSTGSIVGLSVSGGIAALGIICFFVWKFTRKRFADFDDSTSDYVSVSYGLI